MFERRNHVRRVICGGVVVGALAGALLAVLELAWIRFTARPVLLFAGGSLAFGLPSVGLAAGVGALAGFVQGVVVAAVSAAAEALARRRSAEPRWAAVLYTGILTPPVAWLCAEAFSGRRARQLSARGALVVGTGIALLAITYVGLRVLLTIGRRLRSPLPGGRPRIGQAGAAAGALVLAAIALQAVDRHVLVRLYGFFHGTLQLLAFGALELAIVAGSWGSRAGERRWGRLAAPRGALAVALVAVTTGAFGLARFREPAAGGLRALAHEEGGSIGSLLELARRLGLGAAPGLDAAPASAASLVVAPEAAGARGPRRPGADLILISVDALRADHLGAYGYARATSPRLDALAASSTVFERAYAPVPHTSFSIASLLTGKYVYSLARLGLGDGHETLAEVLRKYGYKTAAFFPPAVFYIDGERFKGYEERRYGFEYVRYEPFAEDRDAPARTDQIIRFLDAERPPRVFLWVHYFGPHEPYVDHAEVDAAVAPGDRAVDRYDREIRWVDQEIGRLVEYLDRARPGAVIAVTGDHGEEFGEHGGAYHGTTLYDDQLRVPLVVRVPGVPGRRVAAPVSTIDVAPTLLALLDVPPSARVRGTDLSPWMSAEGAPPESALPPVFAEIDSLKMVTAGAEKLVCDAARGYCRLFDLGADPREATDVSARRPDRVAVLRGLLAAWMASHSDLERPPPAPDGRAGARRAALERAELGDREAAPLLAEVLRDAAAGVEERRAAARALARLPDERARAALAAARGDADVATARWATVALAALGDPGALDAVAAIVADGAAAEPELCARAAMARAAARAAGATDALVSALAVVSEADLRRELVRALGRTRDPRAREILLAEYPTVRERKYVAMALGDLGDRAAVPFLVERLADESYTSVRAAVARSLGQLGDRRARAALRAAFRAEKEAQVASAVARALAALGDAPVRGTVRVPAGAIELWLVPGEGRTEVALRVTVEAAGQAPRNAAVDTSIPRDAYTVPLPPGCTRVTLAPAVPALVR